VMQLESNICGFA